MVELRLKTQFGCSQEEDLYQKICSWSSEGYIANVQLIYACRTPYDSSRCNHYTNVSTILSDHIAYIQITYACRTPYDNSRCNNYTNIRPIRSESFESQQAILK